MSLRRELEEKGLVRIGKDLHDLAASLFPICRSITGNGVRQTLSLLGERIPLEIREVPSGTAVFDWTVPKEWNIRDAYIKTLDGRRVVDFRESNLQVVNYSTPVHATLPLQELKSHLFTLPEHPDWIPYRTSYYREDWGFCLSHRKMLDLKDEAYEVCIDSTLAHGSLSYGECYLPGRSSDEVLISCHVCHPSLANDNLSGIAVATALAGLLGGRSLRYSYRFLFLPGTIGAITWLAQNRSTVAHIRHGLVLTCIGDSGGFHYKRSRRGQTEVDRTVACILRDCGEPFEIVDFSPYGYDERQYCSPGFNLPVGCLMRSVWGTFPEYHSSADNLTFIRPLSLAKSFRVCAEIVDALEQNRRFINQNPYCEPQLGKRDLYRSTGGASIGREVNARLWVLNLSDGQSSLLDIADRSQLPFSEVADAAHLLLEHGLITPAEDG